MSLKILYLEDLATDVEFAKRALLKEKTEFDMLVVDSRESYINALTQFQPDIVLTDHSLPSFDSLEALRLAKNNNTLLPVILITSTIPEDYAVKIMKEGASDYILKDRLQRLPAAIHNAVEKSRFEKERQKYLDEVIANEALMKEIEYLANIGSWKIDLVNNTVIWSEEIYRILGYRPGEIEPSLNNYLKFIHPEEIIPVEKSINNAFLNLNALQINYRIKDRHNQIKHIWSEFTIDRDEYNKPLSVTGFIQDVTESKIAEETIKENQERYKLVTETPGLGVVWTSIDGEILYVNNTLCEITGFSQNEIVGRKFKDLTYAEDLELELPLFEKIIKGRINNYFLEKRFLAKENNIIWVEQNFTCMKNEVGDIKYLIGVLSDITLRKTAEFERDRMTADLVQRNKDLEQFAYIVSHNLRAPTANILGLTDALSNMTSEHDSKELLKDLSYSAQKLDEVIRDINNILQVKREINEKKEIVYFSSLFNDVREIIDKHLVNNNIKFVVNFNEVDEFKTIKSYMHSIFYNLITNSIKYSQPDIPTVIEIKSYRDNDKIGIIFKDNSLGIDLQKNGEHVFGLYKRFHQHVEGKGMGLFMVKTQVESIGGKINLESELGKGSKFIIEFNSD